jgi:catechol 2,3-dioxygenase-like lactoylglutathione lyase family enzyme
VQLAAGRSGILRQSLDRQPAKEINMRTRILAWIFSGIFSVGTALIGFAISKPYIEIVTDQPERTEVFYTDVLGFSVKARDHVDLPGGAAVNLTYLDLGGTVAELVSFEGVPVDPAPPLEHFLRVRLILPEVWSGDAFFYLGEFDRRASGVKDSSASRQRGAPGLRTCGADRRSGWPLAILNAEYWLK